jgi:hypothetical protein
MNTALQIQCSCLVQRRTPPTIGEDETNFPRIQGENITREGREYGNQFGDLRCPVSSLLPHAKNMQIYFCTDSRSRPCEENGEKKAACITLQSKLTHASCISSQSVGISRRLYLLILWGAFCPKRTRSDRRKNRTLIMILC